MGEGVAQSVRWLWQGFVMQRKDPVGHGGYGVGKAIRGGLRQFGQVLVDGDCGAFSVAHCEDDGCCTADDVAASEDAWDGGHAVFIDIDISPAIEFQIWASCGE